MRRQQIAFTPTPLLGAMVARQAEQRGLSLSAVVREALLLYFAEELAALKDEREEEDVGSPRTTPAHAGRYYSSLLEKS